LEFEDRPPALPHLAAPGNHTIRPVIAALSWCHGFPPVDVRRQSDHRPHSFLLKA
jgi:hypothetical protein